jgi:hypothetical protein
MADEVTGATVINDATMLRITVERGGVRRFLMSSTANRQVPKIGETYLYFTKEWDLWGRPESAWTVMGVEEVSATKADLLRFQREGRTVPMVIGD